QGGAPVMASARIAPHPPAGTFSPSARGEGDPLHPLGLRLPHRNLFSTVVAGVVTVLAYLVPSPRERGEG
ncbi:MAG: hypothetical protein ACREEJ_20550, partial [Ensifer adhaerens]